MSSGVLSFAQSPSVEGLKGLVPCACPVTAAIVTGGAVVALTACRLYHKAIRTGEVVLGPCDGPKSPALWHVRGDAFTPLIYQEIYLDKCYFKHGITLEGVEAPFIVDVGANVGFFSRWCAEQFPKATIHCAEPIDVLAQCAVKNTAPYRNRVHVHQVGVSSTSGNATFLFDPAGSAGSSMYVSEMIAPSRNHSIFAVLSALLWDGQRSFPALGWLFRGTSRLLKVPLLNILALLLVVVPIIAFRTFWTYIGGNTKRNVACRLRTLDEVLYVDGGVAPDLPAIDLLKVDVEAAEWDVLMGMSDATWARVKQTVIEVTNVDDRVNKIVALLKEKGFSNVHVDVEEWHMHVILDIKTIFATR